jgi:hypothetical protein
MCDVERGAPDRYCRRRGNRGDSDGDGWNRSKGTQGEERTGAKPRAIGTVGGSTRR